VRPKNKLKERVVVMVCLLNVSEIKLNISNNLNMNINTKDENSSENSDSHKGIKASKGKASKNARQNTLVKIINSSCLLVGPNEHINGQNTLNSVVILELKNQ
jgi:hypothetical protein